MKNNKGFTLVELLAVVAILVLILSLITPKIFKQLKTAENVTDKEQINAIIDTSKLYMNQHSELLPEHNSLYTITLNELKESGLIKSSQILNPSTKEELTGCILVNYENNKYKYEYLNNCKYDVTFDTNGGSVSQTSKEVTYGKTYGDLPTPTREGYTFMGWNGKNVAYNIDAQNYTTYNHQNRTTCEFKTEDNSRYIRINGNSSQTNIDTSWVIYSNQVKLKSGYYNLSLQIRTKNCILQQNIAKRNGTFDGKTGIYRETWSNDNYIATIQNDLSFDNDGEWHNINSKINIPNNIDNAVIVVGNDAPNLYGANCYVDIKNIQLEEGDTATEYEPYYVTSETKITRNYDHTLKAIWKANS